MLQLSRLFVFSTANANPKQIDAGRVLTGLACGGITATVPSYIAELSIPSIRGILTGLFEIAYQIGSVIGFWINYGINQNMDQSSTASWRIPMAVQIIPCGMLLLGGVFLHESPLWLFRNDRVEEGTKALEDIRQLPRDHKCKMDPIPIIRLKKTTGSYTLQILKKTYK